MRLVTFRENQGSPRPQNWGAVPLPTEGIRDWSGGCRDGEGGSCRGSHLRAHCQGHIVQSPGQHIGVTGRHSLHTQQAFLLRLPEKQIQALSQAVRSHLHIRGALSTLFLSESQSPVSLVDQLGWYPSLHPESQFRLRFFDQLQQMVTYCPKSVLPRTGPGQCPQGY